MSGTDDTPHGDRVFENLFGYFEDPEAPENRMRLSELDGFLAAITIGPELLPMEDCFSLMCGDEAASDNIVPIAEVYAAVLERRREIVETIADESFNPLLCSDDADAQVSDWAAGFMSGAEIRSDSWRPLTESERDAALLLPILFAAAGSPEMRQEVGLDIPEWEDGTVDDILGLIAISVVEIAAFWKRRSGRREGRKPGRNEPCPCGSGKKFKMCCGRAG